MRKISHTQFKEPFLEYVLSEIRFRESSKYIKKGGVVADLGCGFNGNHLVRIANKIKKGYGYDISITKNKLPKNISLIKSDINKVFDNKKNYFDTITALAVLEHVEHPKAFLTNIRLALKKGGRVIITTPHKNGKVFLEILSSLGFISKDEIDDHKNYFDRKSIQKLLSTTGFKIRKNYLFGIAWLNLICVAEKV